eukprot:XP_011662612.1 PREDICTED: beta-1,3-N-acetylglucosaminyltransferase radical fringe isoform X2 [Strongylocentrotus purpuratus]
MVRFKVKKTLQYLFFATVVVLVWREFERLDGNHGVKPSHLEAEARGQPLVAGVNEGPDGPVRRSVGGRGGGIDDGGGGGGIRGGGGAWGREPLWQENKQVDAAIVRAKQRDVASEVESKPVLPANLILQKNSSTYKNSSEIAARVNQEKAAKPKTNEKEVKSEGHQVFSVTIEEPKVVQNPNPPLQIKNLSNLVARKPPSNFTIIVQNGDNHSKQQAHKQTELSDVFIGVKTTEKYHSSRLQLILDTWYSLAPEQTYFFTDVDDSDYQDKSNGHMVNTECQGTHSRLALCCKTSKIFSMFYKSDKRWLCHVDDDNYLNVPELMKLLRQFDHNQDHYLGRASLSHPIEALDRDTNQRVSFWFATGGAGFCISKALATKMMVYASGTFERMCQRVRLPDDVTIGFIIEVLLKKPLTKVQTFNSHLQQLARIPTKQLQNQLTLSYSITEKRRNVVNMVSIMSDDPTRFKSFHCTYFRGYGNGNCPAT